MLGANLREKYPNRVPVVVVCKENINITLERTKFLVSSDSTIASFIILLRQYITLKKHEALFLIVNNTLVPNNSNLLSVYNDHKSTDDGLLYIHIAKENTFG